MKQDRTLLLTNLSLYNIKKDSVQRKINVSSIKAITMSTKPGNPEFVVHIKSEYDYRYESDYRDEIFAAIKYVYWKENKVNLPVYGVPFKLKEFHTSKKDISQGVEVNPPEEFRLSNEDIYEETGTPVQMPQQTPSTLASEDDIDGFNKEIE